MCRGLPLLRSSPPPRMLLPMLHLLSHLGTLAQLKHCPYVPLSDLHTRFWRQRFHRQFKCHSLPRTLIQPGINILYLCFPTVGHSGNTSFGFCNGQVLWELVISPPPNPPTWRARGSLFVWSLPFDLFGMGGPKGIILQPTL